MPHIRSRERLDRERSGLLVIDLQAKLCPHVPSADAVVVQALRLAQAADLLQIPSAATVQYPQGLGPLVEPLREQFPAPTSKLDFSAAVCRDFLQSWTDAGRDQIVIAGIETHVCVLQTVLDLIAEGQRPFVVIEAVAAANGQDHEVALERMRDAGAELVTAESVLFEWVGSAADPQFKAISALVKSHRQSVQP